MTERSTIDSCLRDISFPASRDEVYECAAGNSCPSETLGQLREMQVSTYSSKDDVLCHLGDVSACS